MNRPALISPGRRPARQKLTVRRFSDGVVRLRYTALPSKPKAAAREEREDGVPANLERKSCMMDPIETLPSRKDAFMKRTISSALMLLVAGLLLARSIESDAITLAQTAAKSWLARTDAGQSAQSWEEASTIFRAGVTKDAWGKALAQTRTPLGAVKSRTVKSTTFTRSLPGAPDGEYVIAQYDTTFEKKESAVESVTMMKDKDGSWRAAGYFIR
jgi:hypothetical protein